MLAIAAIPMPAIAHPLNETISKIQQAVELLLMTSSAYTVPKTWRFHGAFRTKAPDGDMVVHPSTRRVAFISMEGGTYGLNAF